MCARLEARLCAGRRFGRIHHGHMAQRRLELRAADRAKLRRRTSSRRPRLMAERCLQLRTADRASLSRRTRCRRAGLVAQRCLQLCAADRANLRRRTRCRRTGRMAQRCLQLCAADRAGLRLRAGRGRSRRMTGGRDLLVSRIVAAAARLVCFPADLRTRRRFAGVLCKVMAESCFELCPADRANLRRRTRCRRTGRMAGGCDLCVCRIIAAAARLISLPADLRTRRRLAGVRDKIVPERICKHRAADAAGLCRGAGRCRPGDMPGCRRNDRTADCADLVLRARRIRAPGYALWPGYSACALPGSGCRCLSRCRSLCTSQASSRCTRPNRGRARAPSPAPSIWYYSGSNGCPRSGRSLCTSQAPRDPSPGCGPMHPRCASASPGSGCKCLSPRPPSYSRARSSAHTRPNYDRARGSLAAPSG